MMYGRKIPLTKIRKKLLQNEIKYLRDPPDFDNSESTEQFHEVKKELQLTHSSPSSLARQFYHCK